MRRYRFRLESVLRLRRAEEGQARDALAAANAELRAALGARDAEARRYAGLPRPLGTMTPEVLRSEHATTTLAAATLAGAQQAVSAAAARTAEAQLAWSAAAQRVSVLERLDERRRLEHAEDLRHEEITELDDLVTSRYVSGAVASDHPPPRRAPGIGRAGPIGRAHAVRGGGG